LAKSAKLIPVKTIAVIVGLAGIKALKTYPIKSIRFYSPNLAQCD
jgi:hypothetical protein